MSDALDFSARYKVVSWNLGVAVRPIEHPEEGIEEWIFIGNDDDDHDDDNNWDLQIDWVTDETRVYVIMVGDDKRHLVEVDDLVKLDESEYCPECGQIGCKAYG